ncbi:MAG: hypothetical protein LUH50_16475 [Bacteroides intestinalis]|nr:hypothetical protein [Bacteroides intestinalis]
MKKSVCIIISLLSILCAGCIEKEEKIIKDSCKNIIQKLDLKNLSNNITPCLIAIEKESSKDSVCYQIYSELYQRGVKPIEYTDYFMVNDIYVFILQKKKQVYTISKEIQEELYNWGGGGWILETPYYILTINRTNYSYKLNSQW